MSKVLTTPIKSQSDKNNYRLIKLANGLKVMLIQQPTESEVTQKLAAVCLAIDVGGYDDPADAKGLSHFLEHMCFLGSEKYPQESEYAQFIRNNGGNLNASTSFSDTIYFFTINETELEGAIDRMSSIFISPLMSENAIERELKAVDSEYNLKKNNDSFKANRLFFSAIKSGDPARVFTVGNKFTLRKNDRTNAELYELLNNHRRKFYVANRMNLAVQSSLDLDEQQILVEKYFSDIKSGLIREEASDDIYKDLFDVEKFRKVLYFKSTTDDRKLILNFPLPPAYKHYKCKPLIYIEKLLGDQFEGSLNSYLMKNHLITQLEAADERQFGRKSIASLFNIEIKLTDHGSKNIEEILRAIYAYLHLIKETPMEKHREIFETYQKVSEKSFDYKQMITAQANAHRCSTNMKLYDYEDILRGENLFMDFDENILKKYIDLLNESYFNITIMDYQANIDYNEIEEYNGTEFRRENLPESYEKLWNEREIIADLKLPPKNDFICTNFDIYSMNENVEIMNHPEKIFESPVAEAWYKLHSTFKLPYAQVKVVLISPITVGNSFNIILLQQYTEIMESFLKEKLSSATEAGFDFSLDISLNHQEIDLSFSGYNEKLYKLIDIVTKELKNFNEHLDESIFDVYKNKVQKSIKKGILESGLTFDLRNYLTMKNSTHGYERYQDLENVNFEHLEKFVEKFFKKMKIKILIQGNVTRNEATLISKSIVDNINAESIDDPSSIEGISLKIPEGRHVIKIKSRQKNNKNSFTNDLYDIGERSLKKDCIVELIMKIMRQPTFDTLRTKEQLSYSVSLMSRESVNAVNISVMIKFQEDKHSSKSIALRLKDFIRIDMKKIFEDLSDDSFTRIKDSLINISLRPFDKLEDEVKFYWKQINSDYYSFDHREKTAEMYRKIVKQDLLDFYNENFTKPRNVIIQQIANIVDDETDSDDDLSYIYVTEKDNDEDEIITNIEQFKSILESHRNFKIAYTYD